MGLNLLDTLLKVDLTARFPRDDRALFELDKKIYVDIFVKSAILDLLETAWRVHSLGLPCETCGFGVQPRDGYYRLGFGTPDILGYYLLGRIVIDDTDTKRSVAFHLDVSTEWIDEFLSGYDTEITDSPISEFGYYIRGLVHGFTESPIH